MHLYFVELKEFRWRLSLAARHVVSTKTSPQVMMHDVGVRNRFGRVDLVGIQHVAATVPFAGDTSGPRVFVMETSESLRRTSE